MPERPPAAVFRCLQSALDLFSYLDQEVKPCRKAMEFKLAFGGECQRPANYSGLCCYAECWCLVLPHIYSLFLIFSSADETLARIVLSVGSLGLSCRLQSIPGKNTSMHQDIHTHIDVYNLAIALLVSFTASLHHT